MPPYIYFPTTMHGGSESIPDTLIPYCRELYDRLKADIADDPRKSGAINWVVGMLGVKKSPALKVLNERAQRMQAANVALTTKSSVEKVSAEAVGSTTSRIASEAEGQ